MRGLAVRFILMLVFAGMNLPVALQARAEDSTLADAAADGVLSAEEAGEVVSSMQDVDGALLTEEEVDELVSRLAAEGWAQETMDVEPAVPSGERESLQIRVGRRRTIHLTLPGEGRDSYLALSSSEQARFLRRRSQFLAAATTVLNSTRIFYGVGTLVKNQLRQVFRRGARSRDPLSDLGKSLPQQSTNLRALRWWALETAVRNLDKTLFENARIVSNQNEFSVSASLAVIGEAGVGRRGFGGSAGLGVSFGFNSAKKAIAFEIFSEIEKLDRALTPTAQIGLVPRVGMNVYNQITGAEMNARRGNTVYPPLSYVSATPDLWAMGATTSLMAFPPLLPEFMVYTHQVVRKSLLRVVVSPVLPGWFRINLGRLPRRADWTLEPVAPIAQTLQDSNWTTVSGLSCQSLFTF